MNGYHFVKRVFDVLGALVTLIVLSPVLIVVCVLILLFLGAPIFFRQERVTIGERVFQLWKFRSMLNPDPERGLVSDGQRMTRFGRLLRSSSLDELPSLWNVLCGDMSLIGPRPLPTRYLPHYSDQQRRRHQVRGGLSGMAQISGRNRVRWDDRFDLDVEYVDTVSFGLDLRILMRTISIVLRADGISQDGEVTAENFGGTLKSDLVVFDQRSRTETITTWSVSGSDGHEIGCCEISVISAQTLLIRFDDCTKADPDIEIRREVVRLLTNRARATEAEFAVCAVRADGVDRSVLTEAGFKEIADPEEQLKFGHLASADRILAGCRLWPDEPADLDADTDSHADNSAYADNNEYADTGAGRSRLILFGRARHEAGRGESAMQRPPKADASQ
ncbi:sugar transferase [Brevibacterium aurantiacum]|uniref:Sugar transferase n=1 Tax=Brevibacterium aurantiacum TaxID=273384 RepID=A0A556CR73_BREAU|nr:sugar transferase [Brevibacterium aurantiacum]TSI19796.1 sugar transferase [Brevibacterium aurantiacum]